MTRKYSPHHYTTSSHLNCRYKAGWIHIFILLRPNSDPTIQMLQQKLCLITQGNVFSVFCCPSLVSPCQLAPHFPVLSHNGCQELQPLWSSVAVAHLPKGLMCCVFRNGLLHISVVKSDYYLLKFRSTVSKTLRLAQLVPTTTPFFSILMLAFSFSRSS